MKLAVSGKGGVGKTTFASLLIRTLNKAGKRVLAIDADPDANLAAGLGIENVCRCTQSSEAGIIPADLQLKVGMAAVEREGRRG